MTSQVVSTITEGIRVNVRTVYVREESAPQYQYFVFAYEVEIINESPFSVQLLSREWLITDGIGEKKTVKGDGVIGKQPFIAPGESYKYVSGTQFNTTVGKMCGHYIMEKQVDRSQLRVMIPPFIMVVPFANN
ncbi:MAG: Co2+/Mg2+ efflux protein ApaG [Bacteroidia bacterium]